MEQKNSVITFAIIAVMIAGASGYYFLLNSNSNENNQPPVFRIAQQTFKGEMNGDAVCQIQGIKAFTDNEVSSYAKPSDAQDSDKGTLSSGIHIYHYDQDIKVSDAIKSIKPASSNKVMLAYYPSTGNTTQKFSIYPQAAAEKIGHNTLNLTDTIPANEGFVIFSCKDTDLYKIGDEKKVGIQKLPASFDAVNNSDRWILFSAWTGIKASDFSKYNVKSIWVQKDKGFSFEQASLQNIQLKDGYQMIWVELSPPKVAETPQQQKASCEANPACAGKVCTPYYLGGYSCSAAAVATTTEAQTSCNTACNNSCSAFASGVYACQKFPWASGFFQGVTGVTGYTCGIGISGKGCQVGLATGVSFPDYCKGSGAAFSQTACKGQGGNPY